MNSNYLLSYDQFEHLLKAMDAKKDIDRKYAYDVFILVYHSIEEIEKKQRNISVEKINPIEIVLYLIGEYVYNISSLSNEDKKQFLANQDIKEHMANVICDKYLSLSMFNFKETKLVDKYYPPISSLTLYLNFMINIINSYEKNSPETTLITDLLNKSVSIANCSIKLLNEGYFTESFACWRTLHECECTLILLDKYKETAIPAYLKHMQYGLAYKNGIPDVEQQDEIFVQLKEEMKSLDLKSKDMKKYIEYGWLTAVPGFLDMENYKFNFRDGLERIAGLETYSERYMMSSEILHSTPLLIYSNQKYFYYITLLSTYESFFRLEEVFGKFISNHASNELIEQYQKIHDVYFSQLINIHKKEALGFVSWQEQQK